MYVVDDNDNILNNSLDIVKGRRVSMYRKSGGSNSTVSRSVKKGMATGRKLSEESESDNGAMSMFQAANLESYLFSISDQRSGSAVSASTNFEYGTSTDMGEKNPEGNHISADGVGKNIESVNCVNSCESVAADVSSASEKILGSESVGGTDGVENSTEGATHRQCFQSSCWSDVIGDICEISELKVNEYINAVSSDSEHIEYFANRGIAPIIVDSGTSRSSFKDPILFDYLSENTNPGLKVSMGSLANTSMIDGVGSNFIFPRINLVEGLMWNLIGLGDLTSDPLNWTHEGEGKTWPVYPVTYWYLCL